MLATHLDGAPLTPEHGYPLRLVVPSLYAWKSVKWVRAIEYLTCDRRGFWEERGYHNTADPWREQRYSYQEQDGEGPAARERPWKRRGKRPYRNEKPTLMVIVVPVGWVPLGP